MNKYFLVAFLFTCLQISAQDYSIFDDSYLHEIKINSDEENFWQNLDDEYQDFLDFGTEIPYHSVTVEVDGNLVENAGVRQKGFSSNFFTNTNKKPLKINFGIFVEDQEYDGVEKINLANGQGDPAIIKDKINYDMMRLHGIPSPRVAHVKIYIQDEYWGIYAIIEQIDKKYLKRNFADNDGNLWKNKGNTELKWYGSNPNSYPFELQTNADENDWTKFIELIDFINNSSDIVFEDAIEDIFDLDEYLRILAIDLLTNNWDSYIDHGRNWYLYHEPKTDKIHWLPWDYNFAFDRRPNGFGDFDIILNDPNKVLIYRIFQVPEFRTRYLTYMCEILEVNFTEERLISKLDAQLDLIDDDWNLATNNFFTLNDVQDAINSDTWNGEPFNSQPVQGFKKFIEDRTPVLENDLVNEDFTCVPLAASINFQEVVINEFMANNADGSPWLDQDDENDDWIELYNNTNNPINLSNYFLSDSESFIHKWELPDVSIPANGYLIVWADKDPQQDGLHTKFNLDKDGDEIYLSYLDGTLIDSIEYSEVQNENESLSRIPNGTGDFEVAVVTFNAENSTELGLNDTTLFGVKLYPNPASSNLRIDFSNQLASQIIIYDMLGRDIFNISNNISSQLNLDVSNFNSGIYIVRLISEDYNVSKKVIIE